GEVRRDRVHPRRELLRPVKAMEVAVYADEDLLDEILRPLPVADRPVDEVQKPRLISLDQFGERALLSSEERPDDGRVVQRLESLTCRASQRRPFDCDFSHGSPCPLGTSLKGTTGRTEEIRSRPSEPSFLACSKGQVACRAFQGVWHVSSH